jgi:hypothetical protein
MNISPRPFIVPTSVFVVFPGSKKATGVPLKDLDAGELSVMCDIFRKSIFDGASKADPSKQNVVR